jgi:hypothetical protein
VRTQDVSLDNQRWRRLDSVQDGGLWLSTGMNDWQFTEGSADSSKIPEDQFRGKQVSGEWIWCKLQDRLEDYYAVQDVHLRQRQVREEEKYLCNWMWTDNYLWIKTYKLSNSVCEHKGSSTLGRGDTSRTCKGQVTARLWPCAFGKLWVTTPWWLWEGTMLCPCSISLVF